MSINLPTWIQAGADVLLAFVTTWTLIVLRDYARDNKKIAENSSAQIENSQMPFVTIILRSEPGPTPWAIKNQGFAPALNIYRSRSDGSDKKPMMQWTTPLAPGEEAHVSQGDANLMQSSDGFIVEYESLSGRKFRTVTFWNGPNLKVTFQRLD